MKCLKKYTWVKVPRGEIPFHAKGILIYYMRLASCVAFRKGTARYCGHTNAVEVGSWVGGMVGLKSILEVKKRRDALEIMDELQMLGYITYTLEPPLSGQRTVSCSRRCVSPSASLSSMTLAWSNTFPMTSP